MEPRQPRHHHPKTIALWQGRIAEIRSCGTSRQEYCRRNGFSLFSLRYWEKELASPPDASAPLRFIRLRSPWKASAGGALQELSSGVVLEFRGVTIRLSPGYDRESLGRALEVLGGMWPC